MTVRVTFPAFSGELFTASEMRQLVSALEVRFQALETQDDYNLYDTDTSDLDNRYAQIGHTHVSSEITDLTVPSSIFDLDDVTGPISAGEGIVWDGSQFVAGSLGSSLNLEDLINVNTATATDGQTIIWDTSTLRWIPGDLAEGLITTLFDLTDTDIAGQMAGDLLFNADGTEWQATGLDFQWKPSSLALQLGSSITVNWYDSQNASVKMLEFDASTVPGAEIGHSVVTPYESMAAGFGGTPAHFTHTGGGTYENVTGAVITGLDAGSEYLIMVQAVAGIANSTSNTMRLKNNGVAIADSLMTFETRINAYAGYDWIGVVTVNGDIQLEYNTNVANRVGGISMVAIKTADLGTAFTSTSNTGSQALDNTTDGVKLVPSLTLGNGTKNYLMLGCIRANHGNFAYEAWLADDDTLRLYTTGNDFAMGQRGYSASDDDHFGTFRRIVEAPSSVEYSIYARETTTVGITVDYAFMAAIDLSVFREVYYAYKSDLANAASNTYPATSLTQPTGFTNAVDVLSLDAATITNAGNYGMFWSVLSNQSASGDAADHWATYTIDSGSEVYVRGNTEYPPEGDTPAEQMHNLWGMSSDITLASGESVDAELNVYESQSPTTNYLAENLFVLFSWTVGDVGLDQFIAGNTSYPLELEGTLVGLKNGIGINWDNAAGENVEHLVFSQVGTDYGAGVGTVVANFEGNDGDRTYTGDDGRSWTFVGTSANNQIETTNPKFGVSSYLVGSTGDAVYTDVSAEEADFIPGTRDWYVGFWFYYAASQTGGNDFVAIGDGTPLTNKRVIRWQINNNTPSIAYDSDGNTSEDTYPTFGSFSLTIGTWHYLEFERVGNSIYCYLDGSAHGSAFNCTGDITGSVGTISQLVVSVGGSNFSTGWASTPKTNTLIDAVELIVGANKHGGTAPGSTPTDAPVFLTETFVVGDPTYPTQIDGTVTTITGDAVVSGTFNADGAATLGSTLAITGAATLSSTLDVTGVGSFESDVNVNNTSSLNLNDGSDLWFYSPNNTKIALMGMGNDGVFDFFNGSGVDEFRFESDIRVVSNEKLYALRPTIDTQNAAIYYETAAGANVWALSKQNTTAGDDFRISRYNPVGVFVDNPLTIDWATGDVTLTAQLTVGGNLTISGTTTTINSNVVSIADNIILLNSDETAAPTQDAGFEVERGTSANVQFLWDETNDRWLLDQNTTVSGNFTATGDVSGATIGGITEANLIDKTAAETISGVWSHEANLRIRNGLSQYWYDSTNLLYFRIYQPNLNTFLLNNQAGGNIYFFVNGTQQFQMGETGSRIQRESTHVTGTISSTDAVLNLFNRWESDTDEKGAILTFSDNYFSTGFNPTTRAAIKGGTDTTGNTADGFLAFYTDAAGANSCVEQMRIDHDGNVGIGKVPTDGGDLLQVAGNIRAENGQILATRDDANAIIESQVDGDHFPYIRLQRINGTTKTNRIWHLVVGSSGGFSLTDATGVVSPIVIAAGAATNSISIGVSSMTFAQATTANSTFDVLGDLTVNDASSLFINSADDAEWIEGYHDGSDGYLTTGGVTGGALIFGVGIVCEATAPTVSANAVTVDVEQGNGFEIDLEPATATVTVTLSGAPPTGLYYRGRIKIQQDGTAAQALTWAGGTFVWEGGTAHTMNTTLDGISVYTVETWDGGTTWYASGADYS